MKTKLLIIAFLIVSLLGAFTLKANAQDSTLIADETTLNYNKTGAVIKCSNEAVFNELFKSHGTLFKRRHGKYKYYTAYLSREDAQLIINWAKTNL